MSIRELWRRIYENLLQGYSSTLRHAAELNVYVKLNGRSGSFGSFAADYDGSSRSLTLSNTRFDSVPQYNEHGFYQYNCKQPSTEMANVFFYAKDEVGRFNAWDVELAFFDQNGNWDSRFGANYRFRIE